MKFHRLAKYFPLLEGEDFRLLVESIRDNGQREPIVTYEGEILDGINRYRACQELGIEPVFRELAPDDDPLQYVVDANIRRRHMDVSQRSAIGTEMEPEFAERAAEQKRMRDSEIAKAKPRDEHGGFVATERSDDRRVAADREAASARAQTAKVFGVSGPSIQRAKRIKKLAPDKFAEIIAGKTTLGAADAELRERLAAEREAQDFSREARKVPNERPKAVKEYLDSLAVYRDSIRDALKARAAGMFAPEALQMVRTKHREIALLMADLEEE